MAKHKRQHFVPISYLKRFSRGDSDRQIGLYHIPSGTFVESASLRDQAYGTWFYGKRLVVENALSLVEGESERIIAEVIRLEETPPRGSGAHGALIATVLFLVHRTEYAAQALNEMVDGQMRKVFARTPEVKDHLDDIQFGYQDAPHFALAMGVQFLPVVLDLQTALVTSPAGSPFLTSDHPVVLYNQMMETRRAFGSNTGMQSKGLQIFLPLSPRHCLLCYDDWAYTVGVKAGAPILADEADVMALNVLAYANANTCLYFGDAVAPEMLSAVEIRGKSYRKPAKAVVEEFFSPDDPEGDRHSFLITHRVDLQCCLELSFVGLTKDGEDYDLGAKVVHVRDEKMQIIFAMYQSQVRIGASGYVVFPEWLARISQSATKQQLFEKFLSHAKIGLYTGDQFPEWLAEVEKHEGTAWD